METAEDRLRDDEDLLFSVHSSLHTNIPSRGREERSANDIIVMPFAMRIRYSFRPSPLWACHFPDRYTTTYLSPVGALPRTAFLNLPD